MHESGKDRRTSFISHDTPAEMLQPTVAPFYDPPPLVPAHLTAVLMCRHGVIGPSRYDRLGPALDQQRSHGVAVIASVTYQPPRFATLTLVCLHSDALESGFNQPHFRRGSLLQVYSERSTRAIGQYHKLGSLAALRLPDQRTPFLARMNSPSMKHSSQRTFCWSATWSRKARQRLSSAPLSAHSLRRRWTALFEPYLAGNSLHGAPVHKIQRMPSKHFLSSSAGRPPCAERRRFGKWGLISCHC
jgi:hypothetical protein